MLCISYRAECSSWGCPGLELHSVPTVPKNNSSSPPPLLLPVPLLTPFLPPPLPSSSPFPPLSSPFPFSSSPFSSSPLLLSPLLPPLFLPPSSSSSSSDGGARGAALKTTLPTRLGSTRLPALSLGHSPHHSDGLHTVAVPSLKGPLPLGPSRNLQAERAAHPTESGLRLTRAGRGLHDLTALASVPLPLRLGPGDVGVGGRPAGGGRPHQMDLWETTADTRGLSGQEVFCPTRPLPLLPTHLCPGHPPHTLGHPPMPGTPTPYPRTPTRTWDTHPIA